MKDIMIDIETVGTDPYSVILAIAAVKFDIRTGEVGEQFYRTIDIKSSRKAGLSFDFDTLWWWMGQDENVRNMVFNGKEALVNVLLDLMLFIGDDKEVEIWANSPSFDLSLIQNACERVDIETIWRYWQERDVRTISNLLPDIRKNMKREGAAHHPVSDCIHQINYLVATLNQLKNKL